MYLRLLSNPLPNFIIRLQRLLKCKGSRWPQPLFNVNGGIHRSEHIDTRLYDVLNAELLGIRMETLLKLLDGVEWPIIRENALKSFQTDNPRLDQEFRGWVEKLLKEFERRPERPRYSLRWNRFRARRR